jgi:hypothetical protein
MLRLGGKDGPDDLDGCRGTVSPMLPERLVVCEACAGSVALPRGAVLVECKCGMEYHGLTGEPVDEPICRLLASPPGRSPDR